MKSFVAIALLVAVAAAIPVDPKDATIVKYDSDNIGVEGYKYLYETSDGKTAQEQGYVKNIGAENEALEVQGEFSYVGPDGVIYAVSYTADENGFQPRGAHLPRAQGQ